MTGAQVAKGGLDSVAAVEAALSRAAREVPVRAGSLTLVAVGRDGTSLAEAVARRHPARVIALDLRPDAPEGLAGRIEVGSHMELIHLEAGGAVAGHPASLTNPLLLPELPVFLWWPWDWPPDEGLAAAADRCIVDSRAFSDPAAAFGGLAERVRRRGSECAAGDLNWTRLLPWRRRTARWFDDPGRLEALDGLRLRYSGNPAQAWLFAGWVRARLGRDLPIDLRRVAGRPAGVAEAELAGLKLEAPPAGDAGSLLAAELDVRCDPYYEEALLAVGAGLVAA